MKKHKERRKRSSCFENNGNGKCDGAYGTCPHAERMGCEECRDYVYYKERKQ